MLAFKFLLALAFAALAFGAPYGRRQLQEDADCTYYVVTPSADADGINLGGLTPSVNDDGSVAASEKIAASNLEADELKVLLMSSMAWNEVGGIVCRWGVDFDG
ncbi:hypothetical protein L218DRAFT_1078103 [Marasmius fiardii PR-910]|nr:hypothetical protein L218DRAFT_1078103 [Marasmius fiardii PR-910]